ncbi:hypothetical protein Lesp01_76710 [Lentzea sp. NBRC 102530]|nr:hypothetical protein Lesp01_76710 [Lentzea sp. NBRC 102530]
MACGYLDSSPVSTTGAAQALVGVVRARRVASVVMIRLRTGWKVSGESGVTGRIGHVPRSHLRVVRGLWGLRTPAGGDARGR